MKKSLIINLYGGPGSGKSTCAAYIFSQLKMHNINAELITEQTKAEAYKQNTEFFENQFYIDGCASYQIKQLFGNVDVIITDSPFRMNYLYALDHNKPKLAEAILEDLEQYNQYSKNYLLHVDYWAHQSKRISNAIILYEGLTHNPYIEFLFPIKDMDCPLFVPVIVQNEKRDLIRKKLIEHSIYCPVHWPHPKATCESNLYDMELSLICDQRYNEEDMQRIIDVLNNEE